MYNPMIASFLIIYDNDKLFKLGIYLELDKLVVKLSHQANLTLLVKKRTIAFIVKASAVKYITECFLTKFSQPRQVIKVDG